MVQAPSPSKPPYKPPTSPLDSSESDSATLPLEAALQAANIAPGLFRERFGFENWPDFDATLWQTLKDEAQAARRDTCPAYIGGSDWDDNILEQARRNAAAAGVSQQIEFRYQDIRDLEAPSDRGLLICNPPYGERLGDVQELRSFYRLLGDIFKQQFKGWTAYVFTGNRELAKEVGLRPARRIPLSSGGLDCRLLEFELY
ncbi:THUMP domain-containing class I SAM-dependent RNA methyltransferase [Sodalinema gerasimenkoae]|uniref:THUMP domain-containing class I SAM-dependent RNA methyltransferase n=1 Tax=Sodalinema gerasimenkoae TaxID=2862348 RepID=UPI003CCE316C